MGSLVDSSSFMCQVMESPRMCVRWLVTNVPLPDSPGETLVPNKFGPLSIASN